MSKIAVAEELDEVDYMIRYDDGGEMVNWTHGGGTARCKKKLTNGTTASATRIQ